MSEIYGALWQYNMARVIVVDVSDDYVLSQPPMPSDFYPVLREAWLPTYRLVDQLPKTDLVDGYLYDWHERPETSDGDWYVGVVSQELATKKSEASNLPASLQ